MKTLIKPTSLLGKLQIPVSKSLAHRALICAALSETPSAICGKLEGRDVIATLNCLEKLGASFKKIDENIIKVTPIDKTKTLGKEVELEVFESGSTLRFLLCVAAALGANATFLGSQRLSQRPLDELVSLLKKHGVCIDKSQIPLTVKGKLQSGEFDIDASKSSQFASGLMLVAPILNDGCTIKLCGEVASAGYLDLTLGVMTKFNISINDIGKNHFGICKQSYLAQSPYQVEGDWSSAAFFIVGAALSGDIALAGLNENSKQSDKQILEILKKAGGCALFENNTLHIKKTPLRAVEFDCSNCPDIVPIVSVLLAKAKGISKISGVGRLKYKESDRLAETIRMLRFFNCKCETDGEVLTIYGGNLEANGEFVLPNDHRIAMSATIAATSAEGETTLCGVECVDKSYPNFYKDFKALGGDCDVFSI